MKHCWKKFRMLGILLLLVGLLAAPAGAYTVYVDGVANAGWWADTLEKTHLYVWDQDAGAYAYQWVYNGITPLPWNSLPEFLNDLSDNVLDQAGGISLGNWQVQSGGDPFNQPAAAIWKSLTLPAGNYRLRLTPDSRAYDLKAFAWPNETAQSLWNAYVQIHGRYQGGGTFDLAFGDWSFNRPTEAEVLSYYHNYVDGLPLVLSEPAELLFYINDYNSIDNAYGVTLEVAVVPLPATLLLLGSGLVALALPNWRRR